MGRRSQQPHHAGGAGGGAACVRDFLRLVLGWHVLVDRAGVQIVHDVDDLRGALSDAREPALHMPVGYETLLSELAEIVE